MTYILFALAMAIFVLATISGVADYYMRKEDEKEG